MMKQVIKRCLFCFLAIALIWTVENSSFTAIAAREIETILWDYQGENNEQNWGKIALTCAEGKQQSPIDITETKALDLTNINFRYQPSHLKLINNGRTIRVDYDKGSAIELEGVTYEVKQFHYHSPSEHTINGKSFPAELHIVHEKDGNYAVVGILIAEGAKENPNYKAFIDNLPTEENTERETKIAINAAQLLPKNLTTYRYDGSLTTPPCTEGVHWLLMTTPVELSTKQIEFLQAILQENKRSLQPLGSRQVIRDK